MTMTISVARLAPATEATTANVVMIPSSPPKTAAFRNTPDSLVIVTHKVGRGGGVSEIEKSQLAMTPRT